MGGIEIFRLFGSVLLNGGKETEQQLDNIDKKGNTAGSRLAGIGSTVLKTGTAMVTGMAAGGAALLGIASKSSEASSRISDMSQKMGMSIQGFQEWDFILSQNGASIETMKMGMKTLADAAVSGSEAFKTLGIEVQNTDGSMKSQEQLFQETVTALQGVSDTTKRASLANDLLGRSSMELGPLLNSGAGSVDELRKKAHDLGLVMSDEAVNAGEEFGDSIEQLQKGLGGLLNQALAPLMPMFNSLVQQLITLLPPLMAIIQPLLEKLAPVLGQMLSALLPPIMAILEAFMPLLSPLLDLLVLIINTAVMPLINFLVQILQAILPPLVEIISALMPILQPILDAIGKMLDVLLPLFIKIFDQITKTVLSNFKATLQSLAPVFESVMKALGHLMDFFLALFTGDWEKAWESLKAFFVDIWDAIVGIFKAVVNNIIRGINFLIKALNTIHFEIPDWVPVIGGKSFGIDINEIPLLAAGGDVQRSGAAIVGEDGPELVEFNRGARVTPLGDTGKIEVNINNPLLLNRQAINTIGEQLVDVIRSKKGLRTV